MGGVPCSRVAGYRTVGNYLVMIIGTSFTLDPVVTVSGRPCVIPSGPRAHNRVRPVSRGSFNLSSVRRHAVCFGL